MSDARYELPALPIDSLIASPLLGVMNAQLATARQYADFLMHTCVDDQGRAVTLDFAVDQAEVDGEGRAAGTRTHRLQLPLLAALPHPNLSVTRTRIAFEMEITTSEHESAEDDVRGRTPGASAGADPGPAARRPATFYGRISHHREQGRRTDSRARLSMEIEAERGDPPESLMRVIDFLTESLTRPVRVDTAGSDDEPVVVHDDAAPPAPGDDAPEPT